MADEARDEGKTRKGQMPQYGGDSFPTDPWPVIRAGLLLACVIAVLCFIVAWQGGDESNGPGQKPPKAGMKLPGGLD